MALFSMNPAHGNRGCLTRRTHSVNALPCTAAPKDPETGAYRAQPAPGITEEAIRLLAELDAERAFFGELLQ